MEVTRPELSQTIPDQDLQMSVPVQSLGAVPPRLVANVCSTERSSAVEKERDVRRKKKKKRRECRVLREDIVGIYDFCWGVCLKGNGLFFITTF